MGSLREHSVEDVGLVLRACNGIITHTAEALDCTPVTVNRFITKYPELKPYVKVPEGRGGGSLMAGDIAGEGYHSPTPQDIADSILRNRGNINAVARELNYRSTAAVRIACRKHRVCKEALDDARGEVVFNAQDNIFDAVEEGHLGASKYLLDRLGKDMGYTQRTEVDKRVQNVHSLDQASTSQLIEALRTQSESGALEGIEDAEYEELVEDLQELAGDSIMDESGDETPLLEEEVMADA